MFLAFAFLLSDNTISSHYNAVPCNRIFHTTLQWLDHWSNQSLFSQKTPHILPYWVKNWVSIVMRFEKIDHVIMALPCLCLKVPVQIKVTASNVPSNEIPMLLHLAEIEALVSEQQRIACWVTIPTEYGSPAWHSNGWLKSIWSFAIVAWQLLRYT